MEPCGGLAAELPIAMVAAAMAVDELDVRSGYCGRCWVDCAEYLAASVASGEAMPPE